MVRQSEVIKTSIIINTDVMLAKRKVSITALTERAGIKMANIFILKMEREKKFLCI